MRAPSGRSGPQKQVPLRAADRQFRVPRKSIPLTIDAATLVESLYVLPPVLMLTSRTACPPKGMAAGADLDRRLRWRRVLGFLQLDGLGCSQSDHDQSSRHRWT